MKKTIIGSFISFSFALVVVAIVGYVVTVPSSVNLRDVKTINVKDAISSSINIQDKQEVKKTVNSVDYLNSWKLSATVISTNSFAMVIKGKDSKILKLKDELEGYEVKKIQKEKVLFSTKTDDIWLYIKSKKRTLKNVTRVSKRKNSFSIKKRTFSQFMKSPEKLLKTINIMPEMSNNIFQGMKVVSILEGSFLYRYGLRKGDIIKKINGKKLLSIADGISAYQNILSSNRFSIAVLRDNKIEEFKYDVR
ncbi:hypothetical protein ALC152_15770 [Arcobacter sp. 15-2]|uniref:hypothetical protein n=1 Tax=Arcobacter sp. 15-2 TaxID=3374109 RepID=UPI00399D0EAC